MKKNYLFALLALVVNLASAQIEPTIYRGAFAPAPTAMWTDSWTNWDPQNQAYPDASTVVNVTTNITTNTTWTADKTYKLTGLIYVLNNATLTIQAGTLIKGVYTNTGSALIITKGAKINAIGTAAAPIVFTSAKAPGTRAPGDWGGIILLGKAGFNLGGGLNNIEGITATVNTQYGGGTTPIDTDNSGTMKYCRIEFPGFVLSPNNEINGLTLGSVGNGTVIDYIQVSHCNDDSFEWFGGSVNCKHLVSYRGLDDDFDTDNGYKGVVQFALAIREPSLADNPSISTSEGFESDNNAGGTTSSGTDNTTAIFSNCTLIGPSVRATIAPTASVATGHERALRLRRATELKVYNSIFLDFKNNILFIDGSSTLANASATTPKLVFKNNLLAGTLSSSFSSGFNLNGTNPSTIPGYLSSNSVVNSSTSILTKAYGTSSTDWAAGNLTTSPSNLDYRPGTTASTGADFSDSNLLPYVPVGDSPAVTNRIYCKGAVATPLTANLTTTGAFLKWYTVATGGTGTTTAPTPLTTTVGVRNFWVSQVDIFSIEGPRVLLTVTVNDVPTEVIGAITGQGPLLDPGTNIETAIYASASAVGYYVGTTSTFTYTVPAFTTGANYVWTVPAGANIVDGQGTNSITVNFLNVPYGAGALGSIQLQAENASGCRTAAKTLALTKALPAAPSTLAMFNRASSTPNTALITFGQFMGTTTPLTLTAGFTSKTLLFPSAYFWELPTGVNLVIPAGTPAPTVTTTTYTAEPFFTPSSAPTQVGNKFWEVTNTTYNINVNGVPTNTTVSTAVQKIVGSNPAKTYTFTITAGAIGINPTGTLFTYNGDTYFLTTATTASSTTVVCRSQSATPGNFPTAASTTINGTLTKVSDSSTINFTRIQVAGYGATTSQPYAPYGTKISSNLRSILVNFAGVTNSNVTRIFIGVKASTNVGTSITSNTANSIVVANNALTTASGFNNAPGLYYDTYTETLTAPIAPFTNATSTYALDTKVSTTYANSLLPTIVKSNFPSTAKLLTLTAALPTAPTTLVLTEDPTQIVPAITNISKYIGTSTNLTLTAAAVATAASYVWELPAGVNAIGLSGTGTTVNGITTYITTSRQLTVNFAGIAPGTLTTTIYLGVKAKNGIGLSTTSNATATPATTSTAKLLKLTIALPAAVTAITGQINGVCGNQTYDYSFPASTLAAKYIITAPIGSAVTSASNPSNTSNVLETPNLSFSVLYPSNIATITPRTISVTSVNGYGNSTTSKTVTLTTTMAAIGTVTGGTTFGRCANQTFSIAPIVGATTYNWTVNNGAVIESGLTTNSVSVNFSAVPLTNATVILTISATNACGITSAVKSVTLSQVTCGAKMAANGNVEISKVSEIYPNPSSVSFNLDVTSSKVADVTMSIFNFYGNLVSSENVKLNEGSNTINQNVSNLKQGIYFVKFYNASNDEIIVKKLIKN
jgi:hypothetical protein